MLKVLAWISLALIFIATLSMQFVYLQAEGEYWYTSFYSFWGLFGFIGCLLMIVIAKVIANCLLYRNEDYYDVE